MTSEVRDPHTQLKSLIMDYAEAYDEGRDPDPDEYARRALSLIQQGTGWRGMDDPALERIKRDGTWILVVWDGKTTVASYVDNTNTTVSWEGWSVPSLFPRPRAAEPEKWLPLPDPTTGFAEAAEPVAYMRDAQPDAEDPAYVVCAKGDPGCFPVYTGFAEGVGVTEEALTFTDFEDLATHLGRMASTGTTGSLEEWQAFIAALNDALNNDALANAKPVSEIERETLSSIERWLLDETTIERCGDQVSGVRRHIRESIERYRSHINTEGE